MIIFRALRIFGGIPEMSMSRTLVFLLLVFLPVLNGCGGSATSTAPAASAGIVVSPDTAIITDEAGLAATLSISLASKPTADVTIPVSSSNLSAGTVDKDSLVFTSADWATAQTLTITGANGSLTDGNQSYNILLGPAVSKDALYNGLQQYITATNLEVRAGAFVVSPISGNTSESGVTATFTVRLGSAPSAEVTLPVQSSDLTEGTVDKAVLTFTTLNWEDYQTVTVTGVDDALADGDQLYTIRLGPAASADNIYNNLEPDAISLTNLNVKTGDFIITAISGDTDEAGGQAAFQVRLDSQPAAAVTIPVSSSDLTEGTVSTSLLTFTPEDYSVDQTVTVTGVDDPEADGTQAYSILLGLTSSADDNYNGLDPADISLNNLNVKTGSFEITAISGDTDESGGQATFQVRLDSRPAADVTIPVSSDDLSEGTVDPASLIFTSGNWDQYQTVTVTGVADNLADGDVAYNILLGVATSTDDNYSGLDPADVTVTNRDVRVPGFEITAISGNTNESGGQATFRVRLISPPTANVTIPLSSSNTAEGTVAPASLTFTAANWNTFQTVTVTGVNDAIADGNQTYYIRLAPAVSTDPIYNTLDPADVTVINLDVKTGSLIVSAISGNTDESGKTATFTVRLNSQPAANVTIPTITSSNTAEGTVSPASLTFTSGNWNTNQTVTVTGVDDDLADGNKSYSIVLGTTSSPGDDNFHGLALGPVAVTNVDLVDPYGVTPRISAGNLHSLLLAGDGTVWGWGVCKNRELDPATATCPGSDTFVLPQRLKIARASAVSAGSSFSAIVKFDDGSVWTSGFNEFDRLGRSGGTALAPVTGLTNVTTVATGTYHVLALKNDATVWAWGLAGSGQLGNGVTTPTTSVTPVQATGLSNITHIAAGEYHSLARASNGTVYSWGSDASGQLGQLSTSTDLPTPTAINLLSGVSAIAAGQTSSFAVGTYNGTIDAYGWGMNLDYVLGTAGAGTAADLKNVPTGLNTFTNILFPTKISAGTLHALALSNEVPPKVYSWGDNDGGDPSLIESQENFGALGITANPTTDRQLPTATNFPSGTAPALGSVDIAAGTKFSLVLLNDGRLQSAGNAEKDVLGTNETLSTITENSKTYRYTATPTYVEDTGDTGPGASTHFYAYRPVLSGYPATTTTSTSATITVCKPYSGSPADYCKNITHYRYSRDGVFWSDATPIATPFTVSSLTGPVDVWVKGMTSATNEIQTAASAAKISWTVVAP